jgi:hypothetical protein
MFGEIKTSDLWKRSYATCLTVTMALLSCDAQIYVQSVHLCEIGDFYWSSSENDIPVWRMASTRQTAISYPHEQLNVLYRFFNVCGSS